MSVRLSLLKIKLIIIISSSSMQSARSSYTQTLANSNADITVKDAETDTPLADTVITLANARSSYSLLTDHDGKVTVPIKENGNYTLMAQKDDYVAEKINVAVNCDSQENCSVVLTVSMVPTSQAQGIQVLLEWENMDQDLDLHFTQVLITESPVRPPSTIWMGAKTHRLIITSGMVEKVRLSASRT